jgi:Flp pilus assembly protein TadG
MHANRKPCRSQRERGAVLLITAMMLLFIVFPAVGLAIDGGVAFAVKARLQTAVDGAALAAARSLSRGLSLASQRSAAEATAAQFFTANMHRAWGNVTSPAPTVTWPAAPPKTTIVRVEGTVEAPTYFMRLLGYNTLRLNAAGAANRRDVNIMLVLDRSGSIQNLGACDDLRAAAKSFVETFVDGRDRLGLVTFGTSYRVDFAPAFDFRSRSGSNIVTNIDAIQCIGGTNSAAAYWMAWQQLLALNEPNTLNVILFFTDGQPNTLHMSNLKVKASSTCTNKSDKNGVITPAGTATWGIFQALEPGMPARNPDWVLIPNSGGCSYASSFQNVTNDIESLAPAGSANEVDVFGNSLTGYKTVNPRDGSGRIKLSGAASDGALIVTNAGTNALDNAAARVRSLSSANGLDVYTYSIALGGAPAPAEDVLMRRIANTVDSPIYDSTRPTGMYILAANQGQLEQAFSQLASDILRISH